MKLNKNKIYNILFVVLIGLIVYPNSRIWFMRQFAFSPSIENAANREVISDYNWQLKGLTTTDLDFATAKNKVVFVNFWATWCPPCIAEMPMIQKLYTDYQEKVEFIFVTTDTKEKVEQFYQKNNYNLPTYAMLRDVPQHFAKNNSIPASYVIDKNGAIIISKTGAADWNSTKVRTLLDKLIKE